MSVYGLNICMHEELPTHVAGMRRSSTLSFTITPFLLRFASTFTTTRTGFLRPTRTISDNASVMVALKSPVRLCFGSAVRIRVKHCVKPKSKSLSKCRYVNVLRQSQAN
jgi:hypothetical protein